MSNHCMRYVLALYCFFCLPNLQAQENLQGADIKATDRLPKSTLVDLQSEYDLLRAALEEAHGSIYRFSTKAAIDRQFDLYRNRLKSVQNQQDFIRLLSEMLAQLRDGHMRLEYDEITSADLAKARLFPLRISIEGTRLAVLYNDSPADSSIRPGMEILSINGRKAGDVIHSILPALSGDGYIESGKVRRLERTFAQQYWVLISRSDSFMITAKDAGGKAVSVQLPGILSAEREVNRNANPVNTVIKTTMMRLDGAKENISLRFIHGYDIACLRVRTFDDQLMPGPIDSVFRLLREKNAQALILDLRGNIGGIDEHGALLVSYLYNKPFRYFDRIHLSSIRPSFNTWKPATIDNLREGTVVDPQGGFLVTPKLHTGVALQQPAAVPFTGKLYVLLDGGTFSTAADVTALLRYLTPAVFIGEESGGTMEGNTSGLNALIKLPHSKLGVKINMYAYWNAVSPLNKGRGTLPDHPVVRRVNELLQGIDGAMDRAVELAQKDSKHSSR